MEKQLCDCGQRIPSHLASFFDENDRHICSCERRYKVVDDVFVQDGYEANPVARYDGACGEDS